MLDLFNIVGVINSFLITINLLSEKKLETDHITIAKIVLRFKRSNVSVWIRTSLFSSEDNLRETLIGCILLI